MPGALAEQLPPQEATTERPHLRLVWDADAQQAPETPQVQTPAETSFESEVQANFERWTGALATTGEVQLDLEGSPKINILERIEAARDGDEEARQWLEANIATACAEAVFKEGYVGEIFMERDEHDGLGQHGQTNDEIHHNAIKFRPGRHRVLQDITLAEVENKHRIDGALHAGKLKDHYYVVFSLVPNGVPEDQLGAEGDGYFLDGLTLNIQATTELADGRVKTEVAFMPGVEEDGQDTFEERLEKRHDFDAVRGFYRRFGKQAPENAPELLRTGAYIPKAMMPHGVTDPMYWLDLAKDEVLGQETERSIEDYAELKLTSKRQEASLQGMRRRVFDDLLASDISTPEEGIDQLWELIRVHATQEAFTNTNIDPKVLGREAAVDIAKARHSLEQGNFDQAQIYMQQAHREAVVAGCGGGAGSPKSDTAGKESDGLENVAGVSDQYERRWYKCGEGHFNIREHGQLDAACHQPGCKAVVACG